MIMSVLGHYNNFFFAAHLLDIAMGFKTLRTILSSVTHNGKQVCACVCKCVSVLILYQLAQCVLIGGVTMQCYVGTQLR